MPILINPPQVSVDERALAYGDGGFTSARVVAGQVLGWPQHMQRLQNLVAALDLSVDWAALEHAVTATSAQLGHGVLKIIISRGAGGRGYAPPVQASTVLLLTQPNAALAGQPLLHCGPAIAAQTLALPIGTVTPRLAGLKTLNRLEQVLLHQELDRCNAEARAQHPNHPGAAEGLVFDAQDRLVCGVQSNVFFCRDGRWHTPMLGCSGVAGTFRAMLLARAQALGLDIGHSPCTRAELDTLEGMFFCNAVRGMQPVWLLDHRPLALNAVQRLHDLLCLKPIF